jgi:hypothetical protein
MDPGIYAKVWNADNGTKPFDTVHRFLAAPSGKVVKTARDAFRSIKNHAVVYLVIDRSGSMNAQLMDPELGRKRSRMELAVESADLLANRMQDKDRLALILYDSSVRYAKLTPPGQPLAMTDEGQAQLRAALAREVPKGGTAMRDAIARAWAAKRFKDYLLGRDMQLLALQKEGFRPVSPAISNEEMNQVFGEFVTANELIPDLIKASQVLVPQQDGAVIDALIQTYEKLGDPEGANL